MRTVYILTVVTFTVIAVNITGFQFLHFNLLSSTTY